MEFVDEVRDRVAPIDEAEAIFETLGAKHISHVSVRGDHFHLYRGCLKCFMQRLQHSRARQVDNGRRGQVEDQESDRLSGGADLQPDYLAHLLDIEVKQARLDTSDQQMRNRFV